MAMNVFGELLAPQYLGWLWHGFLVTIGLSLCVCVAATLGGFALCVARLQGRGVVQWAARVYLSVFRLCWFSCFSGISARAPFCLKAFCPG